MKMTGSSQNRLKTIWEKEKLLVTSNLSFSNIVLKKLVLQTRKNQGLFWKGLRDSKTELPTLKVSGMVVRAGLETFKVMKHP